MYRERPKGWMKHLDFIIFDVAALQIGFVLAFFLRHGFSIPYANRLYCNMAFALMLIDFAVIFFGNVYSGVLRRGMFKEASKTVYQTLLIMLFSAFYLFSIQKGEGYSRTVLYLTGGIYCAISFCIRVMWKRAICGLKKHVQYNAMLVATTADQAQEVIEGLREERRRGYRISGIVVMDGGEHTGVDELPERAYLGIPVVATESGLLDHIRREWVDEIIFVLRDMEAYAELTARIVEAGVAVHTSLGKAISEVGRKQIIETFGAYTVMTTSINYVTFRQAFFKRLFDIVGGLAGSVLAIIALIIVGPLIFVKSPGPILFKQVRVGRNGRRFDFLKIRSMTMDAEERKRELMAQNRVRDGMMFKLDFDPRVIGARRLPDGRIKKGIGNFIRDWSIDELPQFFNVLRGDMSLVGTRPPTVDEWEKYQLRHRARLAFRPGITGLWQVSGRSNITDFEEVVRLDTKYINEWDFGLDCRILRATVKAVVDRCGSM